MIEVIPGIFETDWDEIDRKVKLVAPHVSWIQIDFADGTFVPATTCLDFANFSNLTNSSNFTNSLSFEAHLLVVRPEKLIRPLVEAGFKRLIAHVEAEDPRLFLDQARYESVEVGLAIDGPTPLEQIEPFLEEIDVVQVMLAEAGANGQKLQPENLEKVRAIRGHFPDLPIAASQGISDETIKLVRDAGATRLISTSFLFKNPAKITEAIERLKNL